MIKRLKHSVLLVLVTVWFLEVEIWYLYFLWYFMLEYWYLLYYSFKQDEIYFI